MPTKISTPGETTNNRSSVSVAIEQEQINALLACNRSAPRGARTQRQIADAKSLQQGRAPITDARAMEYTRIAIDAGDMEAAYRSKEAFRTHEKIEREIRRVVSEGLPTDRKGLRMLEVKLSGEVACLELRWDQGERTRPVMIKISMKRDRLRLVQDALEAMERAECFEAMAA